MPIEIPMAIPAPIFPIALPIATPTILRPGPTKRHAWEARRNIGG